MHEIHLSSSKQEKVRFLRLKGVVNLLSGEVLYAAISEMVLIPCNRCIYNLELAADNIPSINGASSPGTKSNFDTMSREVNCKINKKFGTSVSMSSKQSARKRLIAYTLVPLTYK